MVQESDFRKRKSRFLPRSSEASKIHSSAVCACAMSPGPNTTLGMPPGDSTAASQKKSTPRGRAWPRFRKNCRTSGSPGSVSSGRAGRQFRAGNCCQQPLCAQPRGDFPAHARLRFARQRSPVNRDGAPVGHDVRLGAAANGADIDRGHAEQPVLAFAQPRRVIGFEHIHNARHLVDGILAKLRRGAMRCLAARFELQPQAALVRGHNLQPRWFADNGQVFSALRRQDNRRLQPPAERTAPARVSSSIKPAKTMSVSSGRDFDSASSHSAVSMAAMEPLVSHAPRP